MRRKSWWWAIAGLSVAVVAVLVVTALRLDFSGRTRENSVVWGANATLPTNFFPLISAGSSVATGQLEVQVLPGPFRLRPDLTVAYDADLLSAEPTSAVAGDRQVVTYRLDPAARWNDGHPMSALDFEFSWRIQRSSDPARGGCPDLLSTTGYNQIRSVKGKDGGRTVNVTFSPPYADWRSLFDQQLFPAHVMDRGSAAANCAMIRQGWPVAGGIPVSAGPWKIDKASVDVGQGTVVLTPDSAYWGRRPRLDRLTWQTFSSDASAVVGALASGEIDVADPEPQLDLIGQLRKLEPGVHTEVGPALRFDHLDFNMRNVHLRQKAVRQAIATALDRPNLVRATVGQFDPAAQVLNNRMYVNNQPEYEDTNDGEYTHGDANAARRLLEGVGYTLGSDGIYVQSGKRLSLQLMTTPKDRLRINTIQVIASQLEAAGIEIRTLPNLRIFDDKNTPTSLESGEFDMALYAWINAPFVTANRSIYETPDGRSSGQQNYTGAGNSRVDRLFRDLSAETDPAKVTAVANRIDRLMWDDLYTIPLFQRQSIISYNSAIVNIGNNPTLVGIGWNANEWELKR
jgi:peptide/nickel transport system substrate-binding protein